MTATLAPGDAGHRARRQLLTEAADYLAERQSPAEHWLRGELAVLEVAAESRAEQ